MKDFKLPRVNTGKSPKAVARQKFPVLRDMKPLKHPGKGIGWKNPLAK